MRQQSERSNKQRYFKIGIASFITLAFLYAMRTPNDTKTSTDTPVTPNTILEFTIPFLFRGEVSSFVAGFGFTKQELASLMEVRVFYLK